MSLSSMLPHDVLGGNFVVLPPTGFLVPQAEKPGSPGQNHRKKGLEGEAKVLGVSPAAWGRWGGRAECGVRAHRERRAWVSVTGSLAAPGPGGRARGPLGLFPYRARGRLLFCSRVTFS